MIFSVKKIGASDHCFNYITDVSRNHQVQKLCKKLEDGIEFKPGINILIGENGCGKSTVINIIREGNLLNHSFKPDPHYLMVSDLDQLQDCYDVFEIKQDLRYAVMNLYRMSEDPKKLASNDLRDGNELMQFLSIEESSKGQNVQGDINQLFNTLFEHTEECYPVVYYANKCAERFPEKTQFNKSGKEVLETLWKNHQEYKDVEPCISVVMDEPDAGQDVENLSRIFRMLSTPRDDMQIIAAIHNVAMIERLSQMENINIIEMSDGYLEKVHKFVNGGFEEEL